MGIWAGTQTPVMLRGIIAQPLNVPVDNVQVAVYEAAGCYGRNGADLVAADAAIMSRRTGRPVRVQWILTFAGCAAAAGIMKIHRTRTLTTHSRR
jgi:CO/xanthine dehydrogenase Mo-binding subunit